LASLADLPNLRADVFQLPVPSRLAGSRSTHPPRVLLLYGSPRKRSYSRLLTEEAARLEFDDASRMKPSAYYDRVVDVMEELVKFTLLTRDIAGYLVDRYSERKESAAKLEERVNLKSI
jgi:hypothetical protein